MKRVNQTRMESSNTGNGYYQDSVTLVTKGLEYEVVSILSLYTTVDFSSNRFERHTPGYLRSLTKLSLSTNSLDGSIPDSLGNLKNLSNLGLWYNQLSSPIPSELENLKNINYLVLHNNQLSGPIPSEFGNLKNLNDLELSANKLSDPIPSELGNLKNLNDLVLSDNQLSGPILSELGNLKNLNYLGLFSNQLSGPIPKELGNLKKLNYLGLSDNQLSGPIPSELGNLIKLNNLGLFTNQLSGSIPILHMSRNILKGKILQCLLQYLLMSHNNLSGELPSSICNLTSLQILDLGRNNLIGAIQQCFGNMTCHLEVLDMQHNNLSGTLPTTFSIGSALRSFNLHGNKLEGKIPRSLKNFQQLEVLDLGDNLLNDTFPMWLGTLPELRVLSLKSNKLHGPIRTLGSENMYPKLRLLDLSSNAFTGNLPTSNHLCHDPNQGPGRDEHSRTVKARDALCLSGDGNRVMDYFAWFGCIELWKVDMISNPKRWEVHLGLVLNVDSQVPQLIHRTSRSQDIQLLLVSSSLLRDFPCHIQSPNDGLEMLKLKVLDLSRNILKGKILQCLGNISGLQYVMMSHNNLSGELPSYICNLKSLQVFDLGRNNLMGAIPQCFGNTSGHLEVLDMQHNNLSGTLTTTFSIGSALGSFNLQGNKLEGKIPRSLENCQRPEVLDLGDNLLNDTFPMWLETLPELRVLSLRYGTQHHVLEPHTYSQAVVFPEWQTAMKQEFDALETNNTWSIVPLPLAACGKSHNCLQGLHEKALSLGLKLHCFCYLESKSAELAAYQFQDISHTWFKQWLAERPDDTGLVEWEEFADAFLDRFFPLDFRKLRAKMSKFISGVNDSVINECRIATLNSDMTLARLMTHAQ
ncbi:hypothetical protein BC332_33552 [Capsicum chinense]|nr:hypothetical protein BC332_33552 [Capsicum chinense]